MDNFTSIWISSLADIMSYGSTVSPRGQETKEVLQRTMVVDMRRPVLDLSERKLSYTFMTAEAYWILNGDDSVEGIAPFNKHISQFSDDGKTFFGAYGPKIVGQLQYVVDKLVQDQDSRQAGLTIWRENPPETKDVPCTIAVFFNIRQGKLNCNVFMRSSDVWLGVPYDVFNFSMLSHLVCCLLTAEGVSIEPGNLYLTAASSHLYARNFEAANACLESSLPGLQPKTPEKMFRSTFALMKRLSDLRYSRPGDWWLRWWETRVGEANENQ